MKTANKFDYGNISHKTNQKEGTRIKRRLPKKKINVHAFSKG